MSLQRKKIFLEDLCGYKGFIAARLHEMIHEMIHGESLQFSDLLIFY